MMKGKVDYFLFRQKLFGGGMNCIGVFTFGTTLKYFMYIVYIMFTNKSQTFIFLFILLLSPVFTNSINIHEIIEKFVEKKVKNKDKSKFSQVRRVSEKIVKMYKIKSISSGKIDFCGQIILSRIFFLHQTTLRGDRGMLCYQFYT